ncbi:hypothetical protein [Pseudorhodoferax soli]|uniref:Uncharacterized protein n=1 Tax=Pseudorhodoferax soli TaxID=545864 RepID=A0A368XMI8_9BURK|nr:hypothetical protein [Pseudorhodoferax soli]RCW69222.1 hypothetical protein DES41_10693 [Pseudorhodoferax soli]
MPARKPTSKTNGNRFEFYVPRVAGTKPALPIGPGAKAVKAPATFVKKNFKVTAHPPFGAPGGLPKNVPIQDIDVLRAALECGYGKRRDWTALLLLNPSEAQDLAAYLLARLQMLLSCIYIDSQGARTPRGFYKTMETSEKAAMSFAAGGIATYLAAREWLSAAGERLDKFLHVGIFTKAIAGAPSPVQYNSTATKWPDYLAVTASGGWHVFESKGGVRRDRWRRVTEGLLQLNAVPQIGWATHPPAAATSMACVHASLDANQPIQVTVVDPPADAPSRPESQPVALIPEVAVLMKTLETIDQFRALTDMPAELRPTIGESWVERDCRQFPGVRASLPAGLLALEAEARDRLALFVATRDAIESEKFRSFSLRPKAAFTQAVDKELAGHALRFRDSPERNQLVELALDYRTDGFLVRVSSALDLNRFADEAARLASVANDISPERGDVVATSGGMRLTRKLREGPSEQTTREVERPRS